MLLLFAALAHSAPQITMTPIDVRLSPARPELRFYFTLPHRSPAPTAVPANVAEKRAHYLESREHAFALRMAGMELLDEAERGADWRTMLSALPISIEERAALSESADVRALRLGVRSLSAGLSRAKADALAELLAWTPDGSIADTATEWAWYTFEQGEYDYMAQFEAHNAAWSDWEETGSGDEPALPTFDRSSVDALLAHARPDDPLAALLRLHVQRLAEVSFDPADLNVLMAHGDEELVETACLHRAILHDEAGEYVEAVALYATLPALDVRHLEGEAYRQLRDWDAAAASQVAILSGEVSPHLRTDANINLIRVALSAADVRSERLADELVAVGVSEQQAVWETAAETALAEAPDQLPPVLDHIEARWPEASVLEAARAWDAPSGDPEQVAKQQTGQLVSCIERLPWQGLEAPVERLDVSVRIRRGTVRALSIDGTTDPDLSACIERRVSGWTFEGRSDLSLSLVAR